MPRGPRWRRVRYSPSAVVVHGTVPRSVTETWPGHHHTLSFGAAWAETFEDLTRRPGRAKTAMRGLPAARERVGGLLPSPPALLGAVEHLGENHRLADAAGVAEHGDQLGGRERGGLLRRFLGLHGLLGLGGLAGHVGEPA